MDVTRPEIDDTVWAWIEPRLPAAFPRRGGQWRDHRQVVEGIAWKFRTGSPWRTLPPRFGPWATVYARWYRWAGDGVFDRLLQEVRTRGEVVHVPSWLVEAGAHTPRSYRKRAIAEAAEQPH